MDDLFIIRLPGSTRTRPVRQKPSSITRMSAETNIRDHRCVLISATRTSAPSLSPLSSTSAEATFEPAHRASEVRAHVRSGWIRISFCSSAPQSDAFSFSFGLPGSHISFTTPMSIPAISVCERYTAPSASSPCSRYRGDVIHCLTSKERSDGSQFAIRRIHSTGEREYYNSR